MNDNNTPSSINTDKSDPDDSTCHLTISEMAERFGVTYRALRFYQQKGLLSPKRKGTSRFYRPRDVAHMKIIMEAKRTGLALTDVKDILNAFHRGGVDGQNRTVMEKLRYQEKILADQYQQIGNQLKETRLLLNERQQSEN